MMKRGILDMLVLIIIGVAAVGIALFVSQVRYEFVTTYNETRNTSISVEETAILNSSENTGYAFNVGILFLIGMIGISGVLAAWFIPAARIFLPISVVFLIIFAILALQASNLLGGFTKNAAFADAMAAFPLWDIIAHYLPYIAVGFGGLMIIASYLGQRSPDGGFA